MPPDATAFERIGSAVVDIVILPSAVGVSARLTSNLMRIAVFPASTTFAVVRMMELARKTAVIEDIVLPLDICACKGPLPKKLEGKFKVILFPGASAPFTVDTN